MPTISSVLRRAGIRLMNSDPQKQGLKSETFHTFDFKKNVKRERQRYEVLKCTFIYV